MAKVNPAVSFHTYASSIIVFFGFLLGLPPLYFFTLFHGRRRVFLALLFASAFSRVLFGTCDVLRHAVLFIVLPPLGPHRSRLYGDENSVAADFLAGNGTLYFSAFPDPFHVYKLG